MYTVKQLSDLAGVSIRTLHYYDEIGLLKPSSVGENGYRYYEEDAALRLQQILFFREMDLGLLQIKDIVDSPDFDLVSALQSHRHALQTKIDRLQNLVQTVDSTIMHLVGEVDMSKKQLFAGFSEEKQKQYEQEAMQQYGEETVKASIKRWNSYTPAQKEQIKAEGGAVYNDLVAAMDKGAESPEVQAILARWHQHIRYFYEPTVDVLRGLGHLYSENPDFIATMQQFHPDLPAFLRPAIDHYCDTLEARVPVTEAVRHGAR
jgi:MerR family transcriptional regulator, thiopeptide resistance regulator